MKGRAGAVPARRRNIGHYFSSETRCISKNI